MPHVGVAGRDPKVCSPGPDIESLVAHGEDEIGFVERERADALHRVGTLPVTP